MAEFCLDCREVTSRKGLCHSFARFLDVPKDYCGNLDAVFDCLGDIVTETIIRVSSASELKNSIGEDYAGRFFSMLGRAASENDLIVLIVE